MKFYILETSLNILLSIDSKDVKLPSFDASGYDNSNRLCFIFPQSLDDGCQLSFELFFLCLSSNECLAWARSKI
uniref:Uncharacterized protein n=1 Tax=Rhizophagus irregularis (strain DAOM 181602 / DAOM 197198 / MUCL 43194) TaxID=747089 RepID=U9SJJ1_RHIID